MWTTLCLTGVLLCVGAAKHPSTTTKTATKTTEPTPTPLSQENFYRILFRREDWNNDGVQSLSEFERLWRMADLNGDGSVNLHEYTSIGPSTRTLASEMYKYLDHDHNGVISLQEIPRMFTDFDTNFDGRITEHEFVTEKMRIYNLVKEDISPDKK